VGLVNKVTNFSKIEKSVKHTIQKNNIICKLTSVNVMLRFINATNKLRQ